MDTTKLAERARAAQYGDGYVGNPFDEDEETVMVFINGKFQEVPKSSANNANAGMVQQIIDPKYA